MPQGTGTYGTKKGRPPKNVKRTAKKMKRLATRTIKAKSKGKLKKVKRIQAKAKKVMTKYRGKTSPRSGMKPVIKDIISKPSQKALAALPKKFLVEFLAGAGYGVKSPKVTKPKARKSPKQSYAKTVYKGKPKLIKLKQRVDKRSIKIKDKNIAKAEAAYIRSNKAKKTYKTTVQKVGKAIKSVVRGNPAKRAAKRKNKLASKVRKAWSAQPDARTDSKQAKKFGRKLKKYKKRTGGTDWYAHGTKKKKK